MDTSQFELIDPRPMSDERYLEIAKWHDCMHPVAASDPPLEEEWYRVNDLIKALAHASARLSTVEAANAELKQELAEQEAEKLALVQDLDRAGQSGVCIQQLALNGVITTEQCEEMMQALSSADWHEYHRLPGSAPARKPAPAPPLEEAVPAAGPTLTQASADNLAQMANWRYVPGVEKPKVDGQGWAYPDNPTNPSGWNVYTGPELQYVGTTSLLCVGEIQQGEPSIKDLGGELLLEPDDCQCELQYMTFESERGRHCAECGGLQVPTPTFEVPSLDYSSVLPTAPAALPTTGEGKEVARG